MLLIYFYIFHCSLICAKGAEKIGVLYSYENVEAYKENNIVGFNKIWKSFLDAFEETYLDHQFLCNISPDTKLEDIGLNVIFFPLAINISQEEKDFLSKFLDHGGSLIVTCGVGPISDNLKDFLSRNGINIKENTVAKQVLMYKIGDVLFELPSSNFYSVFEVIGGGKRILARWKEINEIAIGGNKKIVYIGYSWGQEVDKDKDVITLLKTLDYFWTDLTSRLTRAIEEKEYKEILGEITTIQKEAKSITEIVEQLDLSVPDYKLKKHFDDGIDFSNKFNSNYLLGNNMLARENAELAKNEFAIVYSLGIPVNEYEIRAIWLDRGTIVGMKSAVELRRLIKRLASDGFNVIFFETINAGYPIYPSEILPQNPLVKGWDPLGVAIEAAHTYGVELHAWVWTFAVGNARHNLLVGQPVQYPGPVISKKSTNWALTDENGSMRIEMQPEFWVSPASKEVTDFLGELFSEIVRNYDVDGLQIDYIRFPFQEKESQAGFDFVTKNAFKAASGKLPEKEGPINVVWNEWKIRIISDFVRDLSIKLKEIKPDLKISAAVFGIDRFTRLRIIQQDWETWLLNKWVDVVYPFYYSYSKDEIKGKLEKALEDVNHTSIIVPAYNMRVLNIGEFAERITQTRNSGVLGFALFAVEHLSKPKEELLRVGPFREQTKFIPYNDPLLACQKLLDEFSHIIEKFAVTKKLSVLSSSQTQKEVYYLTAELRNDFKNFLPEKADDIENKLISLQLKVKDWLSLEKYLDREQRAMYISTYLEQIRILLNHIKE